LTNLSSADMRERASVRSLRKNPADDDPIEEALRIRKRLVATNILTQATEEGAASAAEASARRLDAEAHVEELKEAREERKRGSAGASFQEFILQEVRQLSNKVDANVESASRGQLESLRSDLVALQHQLSSFNPESKTGVAVLNETKELLDAAFALVGTVTPPPAPTGDGAAIEDIQFQAWRLRTELQAEERRADREAEREERRARLAMERQFKDEELTLKRESAQRADRFMSETAPKIIDLGQRILNVFVSQAQAAGTTAATTQAAALPSLSNLPEGASAMSCQVCGSRILYRDTWADVLCSGCGAEYHLTVDPTGEEA